MIRKKIYKWHRWLSIIVAVPMIMWSVSGMMHQAGQWVKPKTKKDTVALAQADTSALKISLDNALHQNCYDKIAGSQVVQYRGEYFYQVRLKKLEPCVYISAVDGRLLDRGDERFAISLAFEMLANENAHFGHREFINQFSDRYRKSSKVLPVYGIDVHDGNHTQLYIDTWNRKLTFASNKQRHAFHKWFGYLHSWKFLDRWEFAKAIALTIYSTIAFFAAVLGIYLYLILPVIKKEKREKNRLQRRRHYHRWVGIVASFSMLMFSFSGALHALSDILPVDKTSAEPWHKTIFDNLHMFRFTNAVGKDFRFWVLMIFALINLMTVLTGLIMLTRFVVKKKKKVAMVNPQQTAFEQRPLQAELIN